MMTSSTEHAMRFLHVPLNAVDFFPFETPWKLESVGTFDVPFMSTVEHRGFFLNLNVLFFVSIRKYNEK